MTDMCITKWGTWLCPQCEFKSKRDGDPTELNFDHHNYSTIQEEDQCE